MQKKHSGYFWEFYRWQILAALIVTALAIYLFRAAWTKKECALSVMLLDSHGETSQEQMERELIQALQLNERQYTVSVQSDLMIADTQSGSYAMTSLSRLLADIGSEKLDVCGMLEEDFFKYEASGTFLDLREYMEVEELNAFGDGLVVMGDGRIVGIYADMLPQMQKNGCYDAENGRGVIGIVYNTKRPETAAAYLRWLGS